MKKTFFYLIFLGMMIMILGGCQLKKKEVSSEDKNEITLYYLNTEENGLVKVEKTMELPADAYKAIGMVLKELAKTDKIKDQDYHTVLNKQIMVQSWEIMEDGNANVDFGSGYNQMDTGREVLVRAAVVKSLVQVEGVDTVSFTVNQEPLANEVGDLVGVMRDITFVMDNDKKEVYNYSSTVDLYYSNPEGDGLVKKKVQLEAVDNKPMEQVVLEALKTCEGDDVKSPLPPELLINRISVIHNICYVDLSEDIEQVINGVNEDVKVYSMVNTLTSLGYISQVQFTVEGELKEKLNSVSDFDYPMAFEYRLTEEKK